MLRPFFTWILVLTTTVLVAACCGSKACDCNDRYADAIGLQFSEANSKDTTRGFYPSYIDTVYLVRTPRDTSQRPSADTVLVARANDSTTFIRPVIINNAAPFALATGRKLDAYRYELYLAKSRRATPSYVYKLDNIELETRYQGDGCCTCYQNSSKKVTVINQKGTSQLFDLTDTSGNNELKTITIERF